IEGRALTPANILGAVTRENLKVDDDDAVMVFYSGHGVVDENGHHIFATSGGSLERDELRSKLIDLKVRLAVLVSDTCSSYEGQVAVAPRRVPAVWAGFNDLFFKSSGLVDITAATPGEFAWSQRDKGGFFSIAFAHALCLPKDSFDVDGDDPLTW